MQWITIREFLPALGIRQPQLYRKAALGFTVDNSLSTVEFSIAWRLGHTVIPDMLGTREISDLFRGEVCMLRPIFLQWSHHACCNLALQFRL